MVWSDISNSAVAKLQWLLQRPLIRQFAEASRITIFRLTKNAVPRKRNRVTAQPRVQAVSWQVLIYNFRIIALPQTESLGLCLPLKDCWQIIKLQLGKNWWSELPNWARKTRPLGPVLKSHWIQMLKLTPRACQASIQLMHMKVRTIGS